MSAHCPDCGSDITYPEGTWPLGECRPCSLEAENERLCQQIVALKQRRDDLEEALRYYADQRIFGTEAYTACESLDLPHPMRKRDS